MRSIVIFALLVTLASCGRVAEIGRAPDFTPPAGTAEEQALLTFGVPQGFGVLAPPRPELTNASLWTGERGSLLGDRRAMERGDILTVVIEIDDSASITNSTDRSRSGSQGGSVDALFGLPERWAGALPDGAAPGVALESASTFSGDGSVRRDEQLTLRIAATVVEVLPNGVLSIEGSQQVRVNFELRELLVSGFVRPADISRQNEITYDKIAAARISYGGRGQITDVQQPRYGQQATELLLPF